MAKRTKTKEVCVHCGYTQRTFGLHRSNNITCWNCRGTTMHWHTITWGDEKYAQGKTGKEFNPIFKK